MPLPILKGAEFSRHLEQFRQHPGAVAYDFHYDPKDHTDVIKKSMLWAPDFETAEAIAKRMCMEFGMENYGLRRSRDAIR